MPNLTPKQKLLHASLIKAIHLSRRYKEFYKDNRDEYEELLEEHFGVRSSKNLTIEQLIKFVDFMNFKETTLVYKHKDDGRCSEAQLSMMFGLWKSFASSPTKEALLSFVNRQTKKTYLHLHMISKTEAQKIIPTLKKMQKNIIFL